MEKLIEDWEIDFFFCKYTVKEFPEFAHEWFFGAKLANSRLHNLAVCTVFLSTEAVADVYIDEYIYIYIYIYI